MVNKTPECERVRKELTAFLDGELSREKNEEISAHFQLCPACRREMKLLQDAWAALDQLPVLEVGESFSAALLDRLRPEDGVAPGAMPARRKMARIFSFRSIVLAAASILLLVSLLVLFNRPGEEEILPQTEEQIIAVLDILETMELLEDESGYELVMLLRHSDYETWLDEEEG